MITDPVFYRVVLPYACYGITVERGKIVDVAPIAGWAKGKRLEWFRDWVAKKGGTVERLADDS